MTTIKSERGQMLVIFALALVGLLSLVALAVDGSMIYSDRRLIRMRPIRLPWRVHLPPRLPFRTAPRMSITFFNSERFMTPVTIELSK